jgi:hypothetical protein
VGWSELDPIAPILREEPDEVAKQLHLSQRLEPYDDVNPGGELSAITRIVEWVGSIQC